MKIALVEAGHAADSPSWSVWVAPGDRFASPSVGLISLASLARDGDEVEILDEKVSGPADNLEADLVGISFKTMYAARAYELADALRGRGTRVVLGGLHATLCPDEAAEHADIVVAGEGEAVWPRLLDDVDVGSFKPLYRSPTRPVPIDSLPRQRVELLDHRKYVLHSVQSSRGCSLDCEFCPTRAMFGEGFRLRRVDDVAEEVDRLMSIEKKPLLFTDDVFGAGDPGYIEQLTLRLKELSVRYAVICDLRMLNPKVVRCLAESGCRVMTLNMPGTCLPVEEAAVRAIQAHGIDVWGYFMFGFEFHGRSVFRRVVDFVRRCGIKHVSLTLMTPYPGTPMGNRFEKEGRLLSRDWRLYDQSHVVFKPAGMTPQELEEGFAYCREEIGDRCGIAKIAAAFSPRRPPRRLGAISILLLWLKVFLLAKWTKLTGAMVPKEVDL
jgi:radical SAM superfamily enzyme YgiQ (UPF0313 family)